MLVGEAISKCEHLAGVPLMPETAKRLHLLYLAKGALATTAIEGNTLTEEEAIKRVEGKLELPASKEYLGQEIDKIVKACNGILAEIEAGKSIEISPARIQAFNRQVLEGLPLRDEVSSGSIRTYAVGVANYRGAPAEDCEFLLARLCEWLTGSEWIAQPDTPLATAILKAVVAHLYLAWIHPFGDGNGRTARLLEFQILIDAGVPTPAAHLMSNHYNQTRAEYYRQLERASQSGGDIAPFLVYALQGLWTASVPRLTRSVCSNGTCRGRIMSTTCSSRRYRRAISDADNFSLIFRPSRRGCAGEPSYVSARKWHRSMLGNTEDVIT